MNAHTPAKPFLAEDLAIVEAFAEPCYETTPGGGDFTRITLRAPHYETGSVFVALVDGWLEDGAVHPIEHHGRAYRLTLVPARGRVPWWRGMV